MSMRILIFLSLCFSLVAKPLQVEVKANSALLMNAETGAILFEKHPFAPVYPASTTKIATALYILAEKKPVLDQQMRVSEDSLQKKPLKGDYPPYWWDTDGTRMGLKMGEVLSLEALLHGLMMVSGNDAANVIAEGVSGSVPTFVEEMNQFLKKIGCTNTRFLNPHGSYHPDHMTTAYDLCLITREALRFPFFRELVSKLSYTVPKTNKQPPIELKQANQLLKPGPLYYPRAIGVKTGFHSQGQHSIVAAATHEGRTLIAALLGNSNRTDRYTDAILLFDKAFSEREETKEMFDSEYVFKRQIPEAKTELMATLNQALSISYFPAEEPVCQAFIHWHSFSLPIRKSQVVGELRIVNEKGTMIAKADLFAKKEVKGTFLFVLKETLYSISKIFKVSSVSKPVE